MFSSATISSGSVNSREIRRAILANFIYQTSNDEFVPLNLSGTLTGRRLLNTIPRGLSPGAWRHLHHRRDISALSQIENWINRTYSTTVVKFRFPHVPGIYDEQQVGRRGMEENFGWEPRYHAYGQKEPGRHSSEDEEAYSMRTLKRTYEGTFMCSGVFSRELGCKLWLRVTRIWYPMAAFSSQILT
ncbi:hypothetical protein PTKIN_Ptkin19aG0086100 [Pterospermum kingtungense]